MAIRLLYRVGESPRKTLLLVLYVCLAKQRKKLCVSFTRKHLVSKKEYKLREMIVEYTEEAINSHKVNVHKIKRKFGWVGLLGMGLTNQID